MNKLYAHQGCYLALPDRAYDLTEAPYVNVKVLREEAEHLKREIEEASRLGFTGFVQLFSGLDDLVVYDWLDHPDARRRRVRVEAVGEVIRDLASYCHGLGLEYHLQAYEPLLDEWVSERFEGPNVERILRGRFGEIFARSGCDGIVVTPTEAYDRGTSKWNPLFVGVDGLVQMAEYYHKMIVGELGRSLRFRLWLMTETESQWNALRDRLPPDLVLAVKSTSGDYWISSPLNPVVAAGRSDRSLSVLFDVFHQHQGWGSLLVFDPAWPEATHACLAAGVNEVQVWGSWAPSCIWPNRQAGYLDGEEALWAGTYAENGIWYEDREVARVNIGYLNALLESKTKEAALMQAFATAGWQEDAERLLAAIPHLEVWWEDFTLHTPDVRYELLSVWSTVFQSPRKTWRAALNEVGVEGVIASAVRMQMATNALIALGKGVRSSSLRRVWDETALYFETFTAIRFAVLADPALIPNCDPAMTAQRSRNLLRLVERWRREFPVDGRLWQLTEDYPRGVRPVFLRRGSLADYAMSLPSRQPSDIPSGEPWRWSSWNWESEHDAKDVVGET